MDERKPNKRLNIKSARAHKAAVELSELTGETLTLAVTTALEEKLDLERRKAHGEDMIEKRL